MTAKKTAAAPPVTNEESPGEESPGALPDIGLWKWYHEPPPQNTILARLASLPDQFGGVKLLDFADYVQPLPQNETVRIPQISRRGQPLEVERKVTTWTLYMTVAGRIEMLEAAQVANGWRVDIEPARGQDALGPGFLEVGGMLVYREQVTIWRMAPQYDVPEQALGIRTGQVWIPADARGGAKKSNPVEKAQTAAVGRALGLWGIGILPGSGVASMEEMQLLKQALSEGYAPGAVAVPQDREEAMQQLRTVLEELRQLRGLSEQDFRNGNARYVTDKFGTEAVEQATGAINFSKLKDGQITLWLNHVRTLVRNAKIDAGMGSQVPEEGY